MKIIFEDKSYLEINKLEGGKILITVAAKDPNSKNIVIANTVEVNEEQFKEIIKINS